MEQFLRDKDLKTLDLNAALRLALETWSLGHLTLNEDPRDEIPGADRIAHHALEQVSAASIEAAVLERTSALPITWRSLADADIRPIFATE
jgi:hypothetical protein